MNWKKGLGIGLIFTGMIIIATARILTGAVIGFRPENYLGVFGVLILIAGIVLVVAVSLEKKVKEGPYRKWNTDYDPDLIYKPPLGLKWEREVEPPIKVGDNFYRTKA